MNCLKNFTWPMVSTLKEVDNLAVPNMLKIRHFSARGFSVALPILSVCTEYMWRVEEAARSSCSLCWMRRQGYKLENAAYASMTVSYDLGRPTCAERNAPEHLRRWMT